MNKRFYVFTCWFSLPNQGQISEDSNIKSYGNGNRTCAIEKPYIRTDDKVLSRIKDLLRNGMSPKNVYCINKEPGGVFESHSQSKELRNTQQVYC